MLTWLPKELKHLGLWKFAGAVMYVLHEVILRILLFLVPQISRISQIFALCGLGGKVTQIAQMTQISALFFLSHRLH